MFRIHRSLIVFALLVLFSSPVFAAERFTSSIWDDIWETFKALYFGDEAEGPNVYIPSGFAGDGGMQSMRRGDEGQNVYVPSGKPSTGDAAEGPNVYVPSGLGEGGTKSDEGKDVYVPSGFAPQNQSEGQNVYVPSG